VPTRYTFITPPETPLKKIVFLIVDAVFKKVYGIFDIDAT
jgi:hypothetical protein